MATRKLSERPPVYLDYNATTPLHQEVIEAMQPYISTNFMYGNPSSGHFLGCKAKEGVEKARNEVSLLLSCNSEEVLFTSGGTESINWAIKGTVLENGCTPTKKRHIVTSVVEHVAVLEVCRYLEKHHGVDVDYLPVDEYGCVSVEAVKAAIKDETVLVTIMHANNEVGAINPIADIAKICREKGIIMHTDASQSAGKISISIEELGVDLMTLAGHKLYAPKGVGALYIRSGVSLDVYQHGAGHERGQRAGTENTILIAALGAACRVALRDLTLTEKHCSEMVTRLRDKFLKRLRNTEIEHRINGQREKQLPNTLSISLKGIDAGGLLQRVSTSLCTSAGAACHSGQVKSSHVLKAMGVTDEYAMGTLRLTTGRMTTKDDIDSAVDILADALQCNEQQNGFRKRPSDGMISPNGANKRPRV